MRFTVHRPPYGEVSLCWHRPSGGDVACCVYIGVARSRFAGDAPEDRLALAVFGRDISACRASLRCVRGRDPLEPAPGLVAESDNQLTPPLTTDFTVERPLLRNASAWFVNRAARRAGHRPHVELFHPNSVKPTCKIGGGLLDPISSSAYFARFELRDGQLGSLSAVGASLGAGEALLQSTQPGLLTGGQTRSVQQLAGRQCRRHRHTAIDTHHAAVTRPWDWVGNAREADMPPTSPILSNAVGLHTVRHRLRPSEPNPPNLGYPQLSTTPIEPLDLAWPHPDYSEPFMYPGLAPRRTAMSAHKKAFHGACEIPQCLLLHRLRPSRQPSIFGAGLGQLCRLLVVPRGVPPRLPKLLLLHCQIPHEPRMSAMFRQHDLLSGCRQQQEPGHTRNVNLATDTDGCHRPVRSGISVSSRQKSRRFSAKELR